MDAVQQAMFIWWDADRYTWGQLSWAIEVLDHAGLL
ncbi:Uncharacterised protein [Mycobacteroides abscessus subsp. abscessus]|nr:hypothetical protein [Mycobacteroides abscessus]MBE5519174.1 hypothetical protein [Mycobacteroides abscessus]SII79722.1 Uncharacterised protein [Mycobacteroides abscessus subsp. abscessus]SII85213.1 Uncharacterised protein [Mycobacteroides abscessus subsp. abscessus]SIL59611.1 Uncharacterised protein [Mycobacteroides abscessus subsp. abscessus]